MKYNTIIVPVMASFVALAVAAEHHDQGQYRPVLPPNIDVNPDGPDVNSSTPRQLRDAVNRMPTPAGNGPSFDAMPRPVGNGDSPIDRMPAPIGEGNSPLFSVLGRMPSPVGDGQQLTHMPQPVGDASSPVDRMPQPIGNGNQFDRIPSPVGNGQQLGRMPSPVGDGQQLNRMPEPVGDRQFPRARRSRVHPTRDENADECGFLYIQASDDAFSGYISVNRDDNGRYVVVSDQSQAVITKIKAHNIVPSDGQGYDVMGATFGVAHDESTVDESFRGNSGNFAMLTGTSTTLYGKGPSQGRSSFDDATGAHQRIESAVFTLGENGEIYPSWVDSDGVTTPSVWGVNDQRQVVYSANIGQYNADFGGKSARVFCKNLVP